MAARDQAAPTALAKARTAATYLSSHGILGQSGEQAVGAAQIGVENASGATR